MPAGISVAAPADLVDDAAVERVQPAPIVYGIVNTTASVSADGGTHWVAFRLDVRGGEAHVFNGAATAPVQEAIARLRLKMSASLPGTPLRRPLTFLSAPGPPQTDGSSCGVLACVWLQLAAPARAKGASTKALEDAQLHAIRAALLDLRLRRVSEQL